MIGGLSRPWTDIRQFPTSLINPWELFQNDPEITDRVSVKDVVQRSGYLSKGFYSSSVSSTVKDNWVISDGFGFSLVANIKSRKESRRKTLVSFTKSTFPSQLQRSAIDHNVTISKSKQERCCCSRSLIRSRSITAKPCQG